MRKEKKDHAGVIVPPPLIIGVLITAGLLLHHYFPFYLMLQPEKLPEIMGNFLFIIYGFITLPTVVYILRKKTALSSHGETTELVTDGLFRFSRNPLYLSLLLLFLGIAIRVNSLWLIILLPVLFIMLDRCVVLREEKYLEGKFGDEYLQYKEEVRRWI